MSEKLYSAKCTVEGHGTWCEAAQDQIPDKNGINRLRRKRSKKIIENELDDYCHADDIESTGENNE